MQKEGLILYRRFLDGDKGGLEELIALYQRGLLRFIYGYVRDVALSEDVFTDVFMTLYCKKIPFHGENDAAFKTYLYKIARNKALNALRKRKRRRETSLDALTESGAELFIGDFYSDDIQIEMERKENASLLQKALHTLPPAYSEVLILRYFEDLSPEKIAAITHRTQKQVYNLLARAKNALKEKLSTEETQV